VYQSILSTSAVEKYCPGLPRHPGWEPLLWSNEAKKQNNRKHSYEYFSFEKKITFEITIFLFFILFCCVARQQKMFLKHLRL